MTTLANYLSKNEPETKFRYVGTIWGNEEFDLTGKEAAEIVIKMDDSDEIIDHPAYGGRNGYYLQSDDIWYNANLIEECVLEKRN